MAMTVHRWKNYVVSGRPEDFEREDGAEAGAFCRGAGVRRFTSAGGDSFRPEYRARVCLASGRQYCDTGDYGESGIWGGCAWREGLTCAGAHELWGDQCCSCSQGGPRADQCSVSTSEAGDTRSEGGRFAGGEDECGLSGAGAEGEFDGDREGDQKRCVEGRER